MKLYSLLGLITFVAATASAAQTAPTTKPPLVAGDQAVFQLNYDQVNVKNRGNFAGYSMEGHFLLGKTTEVTPIKWFTDIQGGTVKDNNSQATISSVKGGLTMYFDGWQMLQPYFSAGVQSNYGNFAGNPNAYWAYYVEPGVKVNFGSSIYALASYEYGEGFNANIGSVRNMPKVGVGVDFTKNFGAEVRYEMNQGSYQYNRTVAGLNYKF